jgi:NAD(P)-dependent dehydrogenase (short-subunit alcohol dehydrogenase family)
VTLEKFRFEGKLALIIGGTRGIGLAIAHIIERRLTKALIPARWTAGPNNCSSDADILVNNAGVLT